jgi:hypothetical protein
MFNPSNVHDMIALTILMLFSDCVIVMIFKWHLGTGHFQEHANAFEIHKNIFGHVLL